MVPPILSGGLRPSEQKLTDLARHVILPEGIVTTAWPQVERQMKKMNTPLDEWQRGLCKAVVAKRENGQYACGIGGALISIPRQSGKTYTIGSLVFALCLANKGMLVLWSAHRARTHNETFQTMGAMADRMEIAPFVKRVLTGAGTEAVEFSNGSRILFGARENGFGRGFAKVDIVVLDEAQILTESAMDDMVPATNAAPNGLVLMMGTPPRPKDPGEVFANRRAAALSGEDEDVLYVEFSAKKDANPNDREQWAIANPSFPHRTSETAILRMRKLLGSVDSFLREGLGIWDEEALAAKAVDFSKWEQLIEDDPDPEWPVTAFGLDMNPEHTKVSIVAATQRDDQRPHLELAADAPFSESGTSVLVDWLWERCKRRTPVVIDAFSPARDLLEAKLTQRGIKVQVLTTNDYVAACALMNEAVNKTAGLSHFGQAQLDRSAAAAVKDFLKQRTTSYKWNKENIDDDLAPFIAATCALFGSIKFGRPARSAGPPRKRHAVVL